MKIPALFVANLVLTAVITPSGQNKTPDVDPIVWGALTGNASCVIFAEGHKTTGKFYGIAVTTKTVGKLTVIETQNYDFAQKEVMETQENMNNLMQMAQKDHVKFVKIPEKYSSDLLDKARESCKAGTQ